LVVLNSFGSAVDHLDHEVSTPEKAFWGEWRLYAFDSSGADSQADSAVRALANRRFPRTAAPLLSPLSGEP